MHHRASARSKRCLRFPNTTARRTLKGSLTVRCTQATGARHQAACQGGFSHLRRVVCGSTGRGFARYKNGDEYEGEWRDGQRSGMGSCTFATGEFYDGAWLADRREGVGSTRYASGDKYEGEWKLGQREGKGRAAYANRDRYEGEWKFDKKQGFGTFMAGASGEVYEGQWLCGTYDGTGMYMYASNDVYAGEYMAGKVCVRARQGDASVRVRGREGTA